MRKVTVFNNVSLDGYICDREGDMSWAHNDDPEWNEFTASNARHDATMAFGHTTYELMVQFWPTPAAAAAMPLVATRMNAMPKFVFSRSITSAEWNNTTVLADAVGDVRKLKNEPGEDIVVLGSASIVKQLTDAGLVDEYQIVVHPIVLGGGKTMFEGAQQHKLTLKESRVFANGDVFLRFTA